MKMKKGAIAFIFLLGMCVTANATTMIMSLKQALDRNMVILKSAVSSTKGGKQYVELSMVNISCHEFMVDIDGGLVMQSKQKDAPELLLPGNMPVTLASEKLHKFTVPVYYTQSGATAPKEGTKYFVKERNRTLAMLLDYVHDNHIKSGLAQQAILSVTVRANVAKVYDENRPKVSKNLQNFLMTAVNESIKEEMMLKKAAYAANPKLDPQKVVVDLNCDFARKHNIEIVVYNSKGDAFYNVKQVENISKDGHNVNIIFDKETVPPGTYTIRIKGDERKVLMQKEVQV